MVRRVKRTTIIMLVLAAFLVGLAAARLKLEVPIMPPLICAIFGLVLCRLLRLTAASLFIMAAFLFGVFRGGIYMGHLHDYNQLYKQPVTLLVTATQDANYSERGQLAFVAGNIRVIEPYPQQLIGELNVEGFGTPMVFRGDQVKVSGKIYQTRGGKQGNIRFAQLQVVSRQPTPIDAIRHKFAASVYTALPEPLASLALGLLIGQRSTLPENVAKVLTIVGLTHIVAVSGYNLTIIVRAVQRSIARYSRYQTALWSLAFVLVFVILVGSSPSIIRAALVSFISIFAWYYGRNIRPVLLILLVAAITAGINPVYLWSDIGWYLSFLAFFGVLVISPLIVQRLSRRRQPKLITLVLVETIAAQIMTIPIIIYIFGRTSLISIPANLLVVPLVPLAMLLSVIAGLGGMLLPAISGFLALPARWLLTYMLDVANAFSRIPHVMVERSINLTQMLYMYGLLAGMTIIFWRKNRGKNDIIAESNQEF